MNSIGEGKGHGINGLVTCSPLIRCYLLRLAKLLHRVRPGDVEPAEDGRDDGSLVGVPPNAASSRFEHVLCLSWSR
jgi:hypothetical protein